MSAEPMINALNFFHPLSAEVNEELKKIIRFETRPKNFEILRIGERARNFYFIVKGVGRVYYIRDGVDITDYFAMDNQFFGGLESLVTGKPSEKGMELLEDSELCYVIQSEFETLCDKYHELERLARKMAVFGFLEGQKRVENIRFLSAAERYHELEKTHPGITNRVPLKHIASFLGTTQVSVSRIRSGSQ